MAQSLTDDHTGAAVLPFVLVATEPIICPKLSRGSARLVLHALSRLRIDNMKLLLARTITMEELDERDAALAVVAKEFGAS